MTKIVEDETTESGKAVYKSYKDACVDYCLGFASVLFMNCTWLGYIILWRDYVSSIVLFIVITLFIIFSFIGLIILGIAYTHPIKFYELSSRGKPKR